MIVLLQSFGSRVAKTVTKLFSFPNDDEDTWSDVAIKEFDANAKAHYVLLQTLNDDNIARVIHYKFIYEIWSHLVITHKGISQVKRGKINLLHSQYEIFSMNENESINVMINKFTKITNDLASLGDEIDNDQKMRKVIRALPLSWKVKSASLKEVNDKEKMKFIGLIGNLKTHEME